ncbi:hypothetical protein E2C01_081010 [Portunus trituberculatus]|uniref:Uncharacterized protein n=1 Tax=Portunus trituberculatus TaxID=210409 RepID=A0A5B7J145_PORTR|nr:hypothetical protein [Portunus trituberculatus]
MIPSHSKPRRNLPATAICPPSPSLPLSPPALLSH